MKKRATRVEDMDPAVRAEVVAFLRAWLPDRAKAVYRALIAEDPESWRAHPHFSGGLIVDHVLRGNGLTEAALGVEDLHQVWPDLLRLALEEETGGKPPAQPPPVPDAG